MNMRVFILCIFLTFSCCSFYAQKPGTKTPIPIVNAPDSVYYKLACALAKKPKLLTPADSSYLAITIKNLSNIKDMTFKHGLYSFKYNSPHADRHLFIYLDTGLYIFQPGNFESLIAEYLQYIKNSKLDVPAKSRYLGLICNFIKEEYDLNKE